MYIIYLCNTVGIEIVMRVARSGGLLGYERSHFRTRISGTGVGSVTKEVGVGSCMFVPFRGPLSEGVVCDDTTFLGGIE